MGTAQKLQLKKKLYQNILEMFTLQIRNHLGMTDLQSCQETQMDQADLCHVTSKHDILK
jgi:hypothetical protein